MERQTKTNLLLVTTITFVAIAFALTLPKISADESCLSSCGRYIHKRFCYWPLLGDYDWGADEVVAPCHCTNPIEGFDVNLYWWDNGEWNWLATYQTDANGWVYFDKLPIGRYNLTWCCDWEEIILTCCDEGWEQTNFMQPNRGDKLFRSVFF
ncbi:MAG: hypothetical protein Q6361_03345 [Candidatus Hermodarchaeota archaeon]|jgi:hypothetical protein|nr:hypothetical protein [Candidatus Hermodarchaeota archaeon]